MSLLTLSKTMEETKVACSLTPLILRIEYIVAMAIETYKHVTINLVLLKQRLSMLIKRCDEVCSLPSYLLEEPRGSYVTLFTFGT